MWNHIDGRMALWTIESSGNVTYSPIYGPFAGWTAISIATAPDGGTRLLCVSGDVQRPGYFEFDCGGLTMGELLNDICGGPKPGRKFKAVIPGGSSAPVLPAGIMMDTTMDYDAIAKAGSMLGSGAVIIMDDSRSMVHSLLRLSYFYMHESCGQCTPCREGTGWMWRVMTRMVEGRAEVPEIDTLDQVTRQIEGHTICALGDAAAWPIQGLIRHFRPVMEERIAAYKARGPMRMAAE
jgi:NADH-quinone oxidoreductase subunit F